MIFAGAVILFLTGTYTVSFWLLILSIANGVLGLIRALVDPDWYIENCRAANVHVDLFHPLRRLIITKGLSTCAGAAAAWYVGTKAGFF